MDLATELGMVRPTNIRRFITEHRDELESFGVLHSSRANSSDPLGRGRPSTEFHLNRNQALLTCILSRTDKGRQVSFDMPFSE